MNAPSGGVNVAYEWRLQSCGAGSRGRSQTARQPLRAISPPARPARAITIPATTRFGPEGAFFAGSGISGGPGISSMAGHLSGRIDPGIAASPPFASELPRGRTADPPRDGRGA